MILKRFIQHIKKQDWLAVSIEILIVVIGIFLGLKANDWSNAQNDRKLEKQYLSRLQADLEGSQKIFNTDIERAERALEKLSIAVKTVIKKDISEKDKRLYEKSIGPDSYFIPGYGLNMSVYGELKDTGNMRVISSVIVRTKLADLNQVHSSHIRVADLRNAMRANAWPSVSKYLTEDENGEFKLREDVNHYNVPDRYSAAKTMQLTMLYDIDSMKRILAAIDEALIAVKEEQKQ